MALLRSLIVAFVLATGTPAMSFPLPDRSSPRFHRAAASSSSSDQWTYSVMYESSSCDNVPVAFYAYSDCYYDSELYDCSPVDWTDSPYDSNNISADTLMYNVEACTADIDELTENLYGDQAYLRFDYYTDGNCQTLDAIDTYVVDGDCHAMYALNTSSDEIFTESVRTFVNDNGSITVQVFYNGDCSGDADRKEVFEREKLESNECDNGTIATTTAKAGDSDAQVSNDNDDNSGVGTGTIAGIVVACIVAVGLV